MKNKRFLIFFLCLAVAGYAQAYSPEYDENGRLSFLKADLNRDGYFNIVDIGLFASAWLEQDCGLNNPCEGADIFPEDGDGMIDFRDFSIQAEPHGLCTDPENPACIHVPLTLFEPPSESPFWVVFIPLNVSEGAQGTLGFGSGHGGPRGRVAKMIVLAKPLEVNVEAGPHFPDVTELGTPLNLYTLLPGGVGGRTAAEPLKAGRPYESRLDSKKIRGTFGSYEAKPIEIDVSSYGWQGVNLLLLGGVGISEPTEIHTIGRRYGTLVPAGGRLGDSLVTPRPGLLQGFDYVDRNGETYHCLPSAKMAQVRDFG